jgi:ElaB/YqjD/DUF883 family membrane-anchored ribosome-binding protein
MQKHKNGMKDNMENLVEDARALMVATADVAGEKVTAARERVAAALESAKDAYGEAQKKVAAGAKETDRLIRDHPYHAVGIAFGLGALVGFLWRRRD